MATQKLVEVAAIGAPHPVKGTSIVCVCQVRGGVAADDTLKQELAVSRYPQLEAMQIAEHPVIAVRIQRATSWGNLSVQEGA